MMENEIYVLTPQGEKELRGGTTVLSAAEVELLVRIDGVQTGGQLRASMSSTSSVNRDAARSMVASRSA